MLSPSSRALLLILAIGFAGCAEVKPWQRGTLAHPSMDPKNPARVAREDFVRHGFDAREGSSGGAGEVGGGCGCN